MSTVWRRLHARSRDSFVIDVVPLDREHVLTFIMIVVMLVAMFAMTVGSIVLLVLLG